MNWRTRPYEQNPCLRRYMHGPIEPMQYPERPSLWRWFIRRFF